MDHDRRRLDLSIVVPVYCERDNIDPLLDALVATLGTLAWEVIFVDDDSPDGTATHVRTRAQADSRVRIVQRIGRRGLASACIEGMLVARAPHVAVMDADLQHDESLLPRMFEALAGGADLAVGTRYRPGGGTGELAPMRVQASRAATWLSRLVLKKDLSDPMSGFFMLRREAFEAIVHRLSGKGFKILLDIVASTPGELRIVELPYVMRARRAGRSKLDFMVLWEYAMLLGGKWLGGVPVRFAMFVAVGASGVLCHLLVLELLYRIAGTRFVYAQGAAAATAMTSNFLLNNVFTYADRRLRGAALLRGLASFYAACSAGALISVSVGSLLFEHGVPWWQAGLAGVATASVWNYALTATFTWRTA